MDRIGGVTVGYASAEEAASDAFHPCRILISENRDDTAFLVLDVFEAEDSIDRARPGRRSPPGFEQPAGGRYGLLCRRSDRGWMMAAGGFKKPHMAVTIAWSFTDLERERGVVTIWGDAPPGSDRVRAVFRSRVEERATHEGAFLCAWWDEAPFDDRSPEVTGFRVGGSWQQVRLGGDRRPSRSR